MVVHTGNHWYLIIVDFLRQLVVSIDSLPSVEDQLTLDFAATFNKIQTCYAVANMSTNLSSWKFFSCTDIPKPKNWYDCGVHVIANAYCFIHKLELATDISSLPARRWVQSLADSRPKRLIHKKKKRKELCNAALKAKTCWCPDVNVSFSKTSYDFLMNCDPNGTSSSGWLECGKRDCSGGAQDEKQVFCAENGFTSNVVQSVRT